MSENRSALIVEGNPTDTVRVLIELPRWSRVVSLSIAKARYSLPGTESALTRKSANRVVLYVSN